MSHFHYATIVTGNTITEALSATKLLLDSYQLDGDSDSNRIICDWHHIGGRWSQALQHTPDAPAEDYSTATDGAIFEPEPRPRGANIIRARSLHSPTDTSQQASRDLFRAHVVAAATEGLTPPPFPGSYTDPNFERDLDIMNLSKWMRAAREAWANTAITSQHHPYLPRTVAPYLTDPELYRRFYNSFAQQNRLYGFIIETPRVFAETIPSGLELEGNGTAIYVPEEQAKNPVAALDTQEQIIGNLDPDTAWIVSADLHS